MKLKYCLLAMLLPMLNMMGQSPSSIRPLSIGDMVPDIEITNLYNYPASKLKLTGLKGKLIILDFWSTWCGACIEAFPKMQQLQKDFDNDLQVLLVNTFMGDDIKKVKSFFEKRKQRTGQVVELPYSLQQTSLAAHFPYKFIPHYVWIDQAGKIIATTSQAEVTHANIRSVIEGRKVFLHAKKDLLDFDSNKPLFVNGNGGKEGEFLYRSILTGYVEGIGISTGIRNNAEGKITGFYMYNYSPYSLLRTAFPDKLIYPPNRTVVEASDSKRFENTGEIDSLRYGNSYCYDLTIPPSSMREVLDYMQEDISRLFRVKIIVEMRPIKCLILKTSNQIEKIYTKGGKETIELDNDNIKKYFRNQPVSILVDYLNGLSFLHSMPVIDETKISKKIDLELPDEITDLNFLKSFLLKNGLESYEEERLINVAVISDKAF